VKTVKSCSVRHCTVYVQERLHRIAPTFGRIAQRCRAEPAENLVYTVSQLEVNQGQ